MAKTPRFYLIPLPWTCNECEQYPTCSHAVHANRLRCRRSGGATPCPLRDEGGAVRRRRGLSHLRFLLQFSPIIPSLSDLWGKFSVKGRGIVRRRWGDCLGVAPCFSFRDRVYIEHLPKFRYNCPNANG